MEQESVWLTVALVVAHPALIAALILCARGVMSASTNRDVGPRLLRDYWQMPARLVLLYQIVDRHQLEQQRRYEQVREAAADVGHAGFAGGRTTLQR